MDKIRVLRIINRFNLGGPTYNAAFLSAHLPDRFETRLIGGTHTDGEESSVYICEDIGLHPEIIPEMSRSVSLLNDTRAYKKIKQIIQEYKPHIVHTHASKAGALGRRAAKSLNVPVIVHTFHGHVFHSYFGAMRTSLYKAVERRLAQKSDAIVVISEAQKRELVHQFKVVPEEKAHVIPLGFDLDRFMLRTQEHRDSFRTEFAIDKDTLVLSIVGRLVPIKNHALFIDSLPELFGILGDRLQVVITGDGPERENIRALIREKNLDHVYWPEEKRKAQVILTSWRTDAERVHAGSDVVCLTSLNEGTPVSLIEAQASGVPVVSTRVGGVEDIIRDGETGFICSGFEVQEMTQKLLTLLSNEKLRKQMGAAGPAWVRERYHYTALVAHMTQLYDKLLKDKGVTEVY